MVDKKEFMRYQADIQKTYRNAELLELLSGARAETYVSKKKLEKARMPSRLFKDLPKYVELSGKGLRFTSLGKAVFESQLIVDRKDDITPMPEFFLESVYQKNV